MWIDSRLLAIARDALRSIFAPPPDLTVSEAADKYRILPPTSPAAGEFHTDALPYLRGIQDALGDPLIPEVVWVKGSRVAGTTAGENFILYRILFQRGGILSVWPTIKKYTDWVAEKLDPMIDDCAELRKKIGRQRRRDNPGGRREAGDSSLRKAWPGGWLLGISSKSVPQLKSVGGSVIIFEEPDEYEETGQGDVIELGRTRVREHGSAAKVYINGTPTIAGASKVWALLEASTFRERWVPCPHCGAQQVIKWREGDGDAQAAGKFHFRWEKHEDDGSVVSGTVRYICQHCEEEIDESHKHAMDMAGEWIPRHPERVGRAGAAEGFHSPALISPLLTWEAAAMMFVRGTKDPAIMKVFQNTVLGLPYEEADSKVDAHFLASRMETYGKGVDVPNGAALLVAGVDVQERDGGELHAFVWAIGSDDEVWLVAWTILEGDPHGAQVWKDLAEQVLNRMWRHQSGAPMKIEAMAVDAGYAAEHVHRFCDKHARAFAVIGRAGAGRQVLTAPESTRMSKWRRRGSKQKRPTHIVGIDGLKADLYARLQLKDAGRLDGDAWVAGARFIHFPDWVDPAFFTGLTAERLVSRRRGRAVVRVWEKPDGLNNEPMDGWNYGQAAYRRVEMDQPQIRRKLGEMARKLITWKPEKQAKKKAAPPPPPQVPWALRGGRR